MQKYQHIIELFECILQISVLIFVLLMNFLIFEINSTPKLSKNVTLLPFTYKALRWVPVDLYLLRFITYDY